MAELNAALGIHTITYGNNHIQIIIFKNADNLLPSIRTVQNFRTVDSADNSFESYIFPNMLADIGPYPTETSQQVVPTSTSKLLKSTLKVPKMLIKVSYDS